jgi:hypothetical protein
MSRISDLLISLLGKACKLSSSGYGTSFLYNQTSVIVFTEDHAQCMLFIVSNTVVSFHNPIILLPSFARVLRRSAQFIIS